MKHVLKRAGFCLAFVACAGGSAWAQKQRGQGPQQQAPAAGGQAPESKMNEYEPQFPTKMNWTLAEINGKSPPAEATLVIDEALRGSGASGCNTWSASLYPVRGRRLAMGPVAQTRKTCAADLMQFERTYLTILHSGPTWEQTGSRLTIKGQAGTLVFNRGL